MIERYMRSASMDARSRTALVRLLWDFIGTEFGSRHQQYEKFYGGSSFVGHAVRDMLVRYSKNTRNCKTAQPRTPNKRGRPVDWFAFGSQ